MLLLPSILPFATLAPLAVVPVFVNAGTALLPAVVAPIASAIALLFKPKELWQACRRRPWVPLLVLLVAGGIVAAVAYFASPAHAASPAARGRATASLDRSDHATVAAGPRVDWGRIAQEMIDDDAKPQSPTNSSTNPTSNPTTAPAETAAPTALALPLKAGWTFAPPEGSMILATPAVANGRLYCGSALVDVTGLGSVFCLDANTGTLLWQADTFDADNETELIKPIFSSPAVSADGKSVVVGEGLHADRDSSLLCFDAESGEFRWRVKTPLHLESSPAIRGDTVVVGAGAVEEGDDHHAVGDPGFVLAVRVSTGQVLWKHAVNDPESSPALGDDGTVYIGSGFNGNAVVALRPDSDAELKEKNLSRQLWRTETPYPATGYVMLAGDLVLLGVGNSDYVYADPHPAGAIFALDRADGHLRWKTDLPDSVLGKMAVRGDKLYAPCRSGEVICLSLADGSIVWREPVNGKAPVLGGVTVQGDHVFATSNDGTLAVLDAADGHPIEHYSLNDPKHPPKLFLTLSTPTIADGKLYVGSETGGLRSFTGGK